MSCDNVLPGALTHSHHDPVRRQQVERPSGDHVVVNALRWVAFHSDVLRYFLPGTTLYVTLTVEELPAVSMAVTVNVLVPLDDVSTGVPFATGPLHDVVPEPPSLQA